MTDLTKGNNLSNLMDKITGGMTNALNHHAKHQTSELSWAEEQLKRKQKNKAKKA